MSQENILKETGRIVGTTFSDFLISVGRQAQALKTDRLFFLSGEGRWFARQYEGLRLQSRDPNAFPPGVHLGVSRKSTYLPSFASLECGVAEPLLKQYKDSSAAAVLGSLGIFEDGTVNAQDLSGLDLDLPWATPGLAEHLLIVDAIRLPLERRRQTQRDALLAYFQQKGVFDGKSPPLLIDIGWRGTIQDNIARLAPDQFTMGYYFHLQPFLAPQAENLSKSAFLDKTTVPASAYRRLRFAAPLEFLVRDDSPTVIGYERRGDEIVEIADHSRVASPEVHRAMDRLREGMASCNAARSLDDTPDAKRVLRTVLRFLEHPPKDVAALYFQTQRDERFGAGRIYAPPAEVTYSEFVFGLVQAGRRRRLIRTLAESGWPWALLSLNVPLLAPLLRMVLIALDATVGTKPHAPGR